MGLILGLQCTHAGGLAASPERLARLAELITDARWHYTFKLINVGYISTSPRVPKFAGVIPRAKLQSAVLEALSSASASHVYVGCSRMEVGNHASIQVELGRDILQPGDAQHARGRWRVPDVADVEAAAASWVELAHAMVETMGAMHGVIITATDAYVMDAEISLVNTSIDGQPMHPRQAEITSYQVGRDTLGVKYIRRPRWGTYLKPAHVEAVGGRDKLLAVVKPPVVREVGELLYVQLSERIADATAPDTRTRYRAFCDLVAPIVMPPVPA
ncbi:MAG: hypothetical protein KIT31_24170 [Deltaproteobacteria bacterium]|nr:hypothetical protein [Deltaproteobacteria bacterium]